MAQRVQEGAQMPLLQDKHGQSRLNNPSSTGAKQYLVGSPDLPCWNSAHVYVGWAALSFDPAGRTVTRSHCCLRLTRGQPCLGGSAAIACSTRRGSVGAVPLSQAPLLSEAREVDSAGPNRQLVGLIRSRDPDVLPRRKHNRNPSGGAPCNPMKKSREEHLRKSLFRHLLPKGHLPRISH